MYTAKKAQGYYLSKPLAPAQFDIWLSAYQDMFGRGAEEGLSGAWPGGRPAPARSA